MHKEVGEVSHCLNWGSWSGFILHSIPKLHITVVFSVHSFCCELAATWPILGRDTTMYIQM